MFRQYFSLSLLTTLLLTTFISIHAETCPIKATKCDFSPANATLIQSISFITVDSITATDLLNANLGQYTQLTELIIQNQNTLTQLPAGIFDPLITLTQLTISSCGLTSLPAFLFQKNTRLVTLSLSTNKLTALPERIFDSLTHLQNLYLDNNALTMLPMGVFDQTPSILFLGLSFNQLTEAALPSTVFENLKSLQILDLHHNKITTLRDNMFDQTTQLIRISLSNNLLTSWNYGVFDRLIKLEFLNLASNQLPTPPPAYFDKMTTLTFLSLYGNQMTALPARAFAKLSALKSLDLFSNQLASFSPDVLPTDAQLTHLLIHDNRFTTVPANTFSTLFRLTDNEFMIDRMTPGAPMNLRVVSKSGGSVTLAWDAADVWSLPRPQTKRGEPIVGYTVHYSTDTFTTEQTLTTASNILTITIPNLDLNIQHLFRISARNAAGNGAYSNAASNFELASTNAFLLDLALTGATLFPPFASTFNTFTARVPSTTSMTTLRAIVAAGTATPQLVVSSESGVVVGTYRNGTDVSIALQYGSTMIAVKVSAQDGSSTQLYTITIERPYPNVDLATLSLTGVPFTPVFTPTATSYKAVVSFTTTSITYSATLADTTSLVSVTAGNGTASYISGTSTSMSLQVGQNDLRITVSAPDYSVNKTYIITIGRAIDGMSPIADLASLSLAKGDGDVTPTVTLTQTEYTAFVYSSVDTTSVIAKTADPTATVTVSYGNVTNAAYTSGSAYPITLSYGNQTITFVVTAQDKGHVKTYTLTIFRSNVDVDLATLVVSGWPLLPSYSRRIREYQSGVTYVTDNALVIGSASSTLAVVQARLGNGPWSNPITATETGAASAAVQVPLSPGVNSIDILVIGADRVTTKIYTIKITRGQSIALGAGSVISPSILSWLVAFVLVMMVRHL